MAFGHCLPVAGTTRPPEGGPAPKTLTRVARERGMPVPAARQPLNGQNEVLGSYVGAQESIGDFGVENAPAIQKDDPRLMPGFCQKRDPVSLDERDPRSDGHNVEAPRAQEQHARFFFLFRAYDLNSRHFQ